MAIIEGDVKTSIQVLAIKQKALSDLLISKGIITKEELEKQYQDTIKDFTDLLKEL